MSSTSHANTELPDIDDRLVAPESGYEIDDGKLVRVSPSNPPHAVRHSMLSALLEAHMAAEFCAATDMLVRVSETSDRAPDASVFPRAPDPRTGRRQIDQLAFEIVNTESLAEAAKKAADLAGRGVRRVFAIDVVGLRAFEWSRELGTWSLLDPSSSIEDPALAVPLPLDALVHSARTDDATARALLAKDNPVLVKALDERERKGEANGLKIAIVRALELRRIAITPHEREHILGEQDLARIRRWFDAAMTCATVDEMFAH